MVNNETKKNVLCCRWWQVWWVGRY